MPSLTPAYPEGEEALQNSIHSVGSSTTPKLRRASPVVRCLIWTLILLLLAISVFSVIIWYILHPRVPVIQINSLSVSSFSLLDKHATANAEMGFTVINNNWKTDLGFLRFDVQLLNKNHEISKSYFESFSLQKRNEISKNVKFTVNLGSDVEEEDGAFGMSMDMSKKEVSCLDVSMEGWVVITSGNWYSKRKSMEIFCKDLKVQFSANGTGKLNSDKKHDCSVRFV